MIGESHGNRETCQITAWLLGHLRTSGYGAFAIETGPCSTALLAAAAAREGTAGVEQILRATPFCVAFLNLREETNLLAGAVAGGYECWGIDQEFTGSPRLLLAELERRAQGEAAKKLAAAWLERANAGFAHFAATGSQTRAFMAVAGPRDWQDLTAAFAEESAELRIMLEELRVSQQIYGLHHQGRHYENNRDRVGLMKRHLADRLRAAPATRVLLKFGSAHAGRGYSPFDQLDVGNHVAEVAVARGGASFHVCVLSRRSIGEDGAATEAPGDQGALRDLLSVGSAAAVDVFDLTALRAQLTSEAAKREHAELRNLVFRFDALVLLPEFHSSEPIVPMPRPR